MKHVKQMLLTLLVILLVAAPFEASAATTSKTISKTAKTVQLKAGKKYKLKVKGASNAKWTAKNNKVLKITKKGTLTAKKAGQTKITYKIGSKKRTVKVVIKKAAVKKTSASSQSQPAASQQTAEVPSSYTSTEYVYTSATGSKYHKINNCGSMNPDKATRRTVDEAEALGYTACKTCYK